MASRLFGYHAATSFMHQQDALSKFMWLLVASTLPFVMWKSWQVALEVLVLLLISMFLSKIPLADVYKSWRLFLLLGSLLFFFHITTRHEGALLFRIWFIPINQDGVEMGVLFGARVVAIMGASYIFVRTTNPRELVVGLIHLGLNYRYAWMLFIALISLPVYESELVVIREAQAVRGIRPSTNPIAERIQMYRRYMMPMLVSGLRRVENLAVGMDSRAFGAFPERTFIDGFSWSKTGLAFLIGTLVIFVALLAARIRQA
jgi:energy-coupling factor transport system permease protein